MHMALMIAGPVVLSAIGFGLIFVSKSSHFETIHQVILKILIIDPWLSSLNMRNLASYPRLYH